MLLTSAKSRFIRLGSVIVSAMPFTALQAMLSMSSNAFSMGRFGA